MRDVNSSVLMGARLLPFTEILVIDIGSLFGADRASFVEVARKIGDASKPIGFFYSENHRVPAGLLERTYAHSRRFQDSSLGQHSIDWPPWKNRATTISPRRGCTKPSICPETSRLTIQIFARQHHAGSQ